MSLADGLRGVFAKLGIEITGREKLAAANREVDGARESLKHLGEALAGSALVLGLRNFVNEYTEAGSSIQDAADRLGIGTDAIQELQFSFEQAGVRGEQVNAALTGLSQRMEQVRSGAGPAAGAFRALGVRVTDASGHMRSADDVMGDIASSMGRVQDPARRVALATQLFGGAGRRLVGVLHDGSGGLAEMRARFRELGGGMSEDGVHAADQFGDPAHELDVALLGLKTRIAVVILPVLRSLVDVATRITAGFTSLTRHSHLVEAGFIAGGIALTVRFLPAIQNGVRAFVAFTRAQALSMAGVILLVLAIDDLIALFSGGQSIIGDFIDRLFGVGAAASMVRELNAALREARALLSGDFGAEQEQRDRARATDNARADAMERYANAMVRASNAGLDVSALPSQLNGRIAHTSTAQIDTLTAALGDAAMPGRGQAYLNRFASAEQRMESDAHASATAGIAGHVATGGSARVPAGGSVVQHNDNRRVNIHVTQRPGEDGAALAQRVALEVRRQNAVEADANHPIPQNGGSP